MADSPVFKTRARLIIQLGEQLIKDESIALLELIKNSYDADALNCDVQIKYPQNTEKGIISIYDDGDGMDYKILSTAWLELGTDMKNELLKNEDINKRRTEKYHRLRLGEKGIGRFGAHRLGREILIISRQKNKKEVVLEINWDEIENSKYIEDLPVKIIERMPQEFKNCTGTFIQIKKLRMPWNREKARICKRVIESLNSPFNSSTDFHVKFTITDTQADWFEGLLTFDQVQEYKLFSFNAVLEGNLITKFKYEFSPWKSMTKLEPRVIDEKDNEIVKIKRMVYEDDDLKKNERLIDINLSKFHIGPVNFRGIIFDRDPKVLNLGVQDKKGLKKYLDVNGGIRVFRDNMRVMNYGEPGYDWLELGMRRVNMPAVRISNNIVIGAVYLNKDESSDLIEISNREGFVENEAFYELSRALIYVLGQIENFRHHDKNLLRLHYGIQDTSQPVISSLSDLKEVIENNIKEEDIKKKAFNFINRIQTDFEKITNNLIKSAGAGLNLIMVIHQIDKIVKDLQAMLKSGNTDEYILKRVSELSKIIEGYSILVKKSDIKTRDVIKIINQSISNLSFRFETHKIEIVKSYLNASINTEAMYSEDHLLNALMNIFDNSIWWMDYEKTKNSSIYIGLADCPEGFLSIVIADNGPGFSLPTEDIIQPFITNKPEGVGMGIGLHLTDQIMISLGGKLLFPEQDDYNIPGKFKEGAIIAFALRRS
ncbi:MAG: sensor histidine kinase [Brevinematales bacterium]|nr:sensor histidine kinase [Brevinematales bacterium]